MFRFLILFLITSFAFQLKAQDAKAEWEKAKVLLDAENYAEAKPFLINVYKEIKRPLCAYYLGVAFDLEMQLDSAIYYYEEAIHNNSKPMIQALADLIRAQMRQLDLDAAYTNALAAVKQYPDNKTLIHLFKSICSWTYMIQHQGLNENYLSNPTALATYKVKTITEQYLIIENLRNSKNQPADVANRQYKGDFEIWKCKFSGEKEQFEIRFDLVDRDVQRQLDIQYAKAKEVYNNKANSTRMRIGAMLALTPLDDKELSVFLEHSDDWAIRICACSEIKAHSARKYKTMCLKDKEEAVQKMSESMSEMK